MTEQSVLKDVMESFPDFEPAPLNLSPIMAAGGRLRRRRRFAVGTASALAVVAVFAGGDQLLRVSGAPAPAGPGVRPLLSSPAPIRVSGRLVQGDPARRGSPGQVPSAVDSSAPGVLGRVVQTGQWVDGRQWILYVETVDPDRIDDDLTLVLGRTRTGYLNDFSTDIVSSDTGRGRMSPGFHAVRPGAVLAGRTTPTFGYYAGDARKITARDTRTGRTVQAHLTAWTGFGAHENAQIFWFDFAPGQDPMALTDLTAYDGKGAQLPR